MFLNIKQILASLAMILVFVAGDVVAQDLNSVVSDIKKREAGNAMAAALADLHLAPSTNYRLNGSVGYFEKDTALAFQAGVRLNDNYTWDAGIGIEIPNGLVAGRLALSGEW